MSGLIGRPGTMDIELGEAWDLPEPDFLAGARRFFDAAESVFDAVGFKTAAENLRRYRSGQGGMRVYADEEVAAHPAFLDAEDENRSRFESQTFTGRTGSDELNDTLRGLDDGKTYSFIDHFDRDFGISRPSTNLGFGQTGTRSRGNFEATRNGDELTLRGTVTHGLHGPGEVDSEAFDFNPGQVGDRQARLLEDAGEAAPFRMSYERQQDVTARVRREPDGALTLLRTDWGPIR